jgi:multidrug resistance efflux pump
MDTKRKIAKPPLWRKFWYVFPIVLFVLASFFLKGFLGDASFFIDRNELVIAKVEQGHFRVNVRATGVLKPLNIRWVSSQVSGRAEQVFVKPGAKVNKGDVLVQLSNPDLLRNLEKARWELEAKKAESHVSFVMLESQIVDLNNSVLSAEYRYQSAKLKLDAETELLAQGNATVSAIEYQRSQLLVKQQMQSWQAQKQKAKKMEVNLTATKIAQKARIGLVDNNYHRVKAQVEALQVRASTSGVIQQISLELGEQTLVGDNVALIADQKSLFAELQVQEVRVRDIAIGQSVTIDTRTSEITGKVIRIDPAVISGMVLVDVKLSGDIPAEARPELAVDGLIAISNIENTLYVRRPVYAPRHTKVSLYRLSADQHFASKKLVSLGQSSVNKIQILDGLTLGDEIIISDSSNWQQHHEIKIN